MYEHTHTLRVFIRTFALTHSRALCVCVCVQIATSEPRNCSWLLNQAYTQQAKFNRSNTEHFAYLSQTNHEYGVQTKIAREIGLFFFLVIFCIFICLQTQGHGQMWSKRCIRYKCIHFLLPHFVNRVNNQVAVVHRLNGVFSNCLNWNASMWLERVLVNKSEKIIIYKCFRKMPTFLFRNRRSVLDAFWIASPRRCVINEH